MAERNATTLALLTEAGDAAERIDLQELLRRRNITLPVCDIQEELQKVRKSAA